MGHRIAKHVYDDSWSLEKSTYYLLDAQGNAMSVYEYVVDAGSSTVTYAQEEKYIYGSSRVGVLKETVYLLGSVTLTDDMSNQVHITGQRSYELTNHLGNVLSVISDKVIPHDDDSDGFADWYLADILQATDYSPFGVTLHGRNFTKTGAEKFRFGFQNQEMDDEIKGQGNSVNFEYRMHDPRLGRFFAIDPLAKRYPRNSPYAFSENTVVNAVELEGREKLEAYFVPVFKLTLTLNNRKDYPAFHFDYDHPPKPETIDFFPPVRQTTYDYIKENIGVGFNGVFGVASESIDASLKGSVAYNPIRGFQMGLSGKFTYTFPNPEKKEGGEDGPLQSGASVSVQGDVVVENDGTVNTAAKGTVQPGSTFVDETAKKNTEEREKVLEAMECPEAENTDAQTKEITDKTNESIQRVVEPFQEAAEEAKKKKFEKSEKSTGGG